MWKIFNFFILNFLFFTKNALACSVCYGNPEAPMTKGLNMGILTLLVIILAVLAGFANFFLQIRKRSTLVK